ncbi:hypothetical protein [Tenacibaculum holothuriorum]|uniref:hypothetical protein n=1 Tax=Tenacibaculum holothuriorum TaxID=1635173 RepID=UPI000A32477A|nr:hypothetical protein [Tenacibaculum holothuriorum]
MYFSNYKPNKNNINTESELTQITIKEENICEYSNILKDGKYYATRYFNRIINESIDTDENKNIRTYESDSKLFDFETKDVEEIEYYQYNDKKENSLHRVEYNKEYWDSFYKKNI